MRLTLVLLGWTFDWSAEPTVAEDDGEPAAALNGGTTQGYFMAPNPSTATVEDCPLPQRTPAWDDEE